MSKAWACVVVAGITVLLSGFVQIVPADAQIEPNYAAAEQLLGWNLSPKVAGDEVDPHWLDLGPRFWYRDKTGSGHQFVLVDPERNSQELAFDHVALAAAMSMANDTSYVGSRLPFEEFDFAEDGQAIEFEASDRHFLCDIRQYTCVVGDTLPDKRAFSTSPDGRWEAFIHEYNLWVRSTERGDSIQLTTDGVKGYSYGSSEPRPSDIIEGDVSRPVLQWSPDSRHIAVERMDELDVKRMPLYSSTSQRPELYTYPYALPGDSIIAQFDIYIVDVPTGSSRKVDYLPHPAPILGMTGMNDSTWVVVEWSDDSERLYFTHSTRGSKRTQLMVTDLQGRAPRVLAYDSSATWVELKHGGRTPPNWTIVNDGRDVIWFSQRDGWGHLYRFGPDGELKNQITSGAYTVDEIKYVDEENEWIYYTAWGSEDDRHPYHAQLFRVGFDGTGNTLITPEASHHDVTFSPDGEFFVDTYSTVTEPPVTVLRSVPNGNVVRTLEEADISRILQVGWHAPEPFVAKARDGVTNVYGLLYKPSDFDSTKTYPVIEYIYPGPQVGSVGSWSWEAGRRGNAEALAELGYIVVQLDHMGTPWRSKAFHDAYYGDMADHGLPDHVTALKQLAARNPWIDLDRVGIYGHSGGGFASTAAMFQYPDFYKVAVSSSGNHDNRTYGLYWGEKYQGLLESDTIRGTDNFASQANKLLAENLEGKLFLMHGDMDDNVHPAMTIQVVDALIDANKSFDLLIVPDRYHGLDDPYVIRRRWDYFVEHLLGVEPPENYEIVRPDNG